MSDSPENGQMLGRNIVGTFSMTNEAVWHQKFVHANLCIILEAKFVCQFVKDHDFLKLSNKILYFTYFGG